MLVVEVKGQAHDTGPSLKSRLEKILFGEDCVLPSDIAIVTIVGLHGDDLSALHMGLDNTLEIAAAVTAASGVEGAVPLVIGLGFHGHVCSSIDIMSAL